MAREGRVSLFTSSLLLDELADVLSREKWAAMLTASQTNAAYLMQCYGMLVKVVGTQPIARIVPYDPDDDALIACALAARARGNAPPARLRAWNPTVSFAHVFEIGYS